MSYKLIVPSSVVCALVTVLIIVFYLSPHIVSSQDEVIGFLTLIVEEITGLGIVIQQVLNVDYSSSTSQYYLIHDLIYWKLYSLITNFSLKRSS